MLSNRHAILIAISIVLTTLAHADQGSFTNSGGSGSGGAGISVTSPVASPAGSLSMNCPGIGPTTCSGGSLTYSSNDGITLINAAFTSGSFAEGCAGGGKGGHVTCGYSFAGYFSGTLTVNGVAQAIVGVTYQGFDVSGGTAPPTGRTAYNSAYAPFYYSDSEQIHRADDLMGTNQISYGGQGGDAGQFYGAYGIALDATGRIYVADTYNCRIVRIDDMNGTNWTSFGTCGSGQGQFYDPSGIAIDSAGKIYVMDTGNCRVVRIDDLNGTNWIAYGSVGSGTGQFAQYLTSLAVDSAARIYVADTGNKRVVRIDDMNGTNWTALTSSPVVNGVSYSLQSPAAVALDAAGKIYIADNEYYQPAVVRVDDITGANWTGIYPGSGGGLNSIAVDAGGTVFTGGGGAKWVDGMSGVLNSSGNLGPIGSYYVFGVTPVPLPTPRPSAISFQPPAVSFSQNVGTTGSQTVTVTNFGGSPLNLGPISATGGFGETNTCGSQLTAGATCAVTLTFTPSAPGTVSGTLQINDDSGNLGAAQSIAISAEGTVPAASVSPKSLSFSSVVVNTTSNPRTVTLQDTGTGPMQISNVSVTGPFTQTNTCSGALAAGDACTIAVSFSPIALGSATGTLTIVDEAGTQTVPLGGSGVAPVTLSPSSLNFGNVAVGSTSAARSITLENRTSSTLTFTSIVASAGFAIATNTCSAGVVAGEACSVGVTFTPGALGAASGTLTFTDSAANGPQTVNFSGTGSAPVTLSASSLSFSTTVVGNTSSSHSVTLANNQSTALTFNGIAVTTGFHIASTTCGASLAGAASCSVSVTFIPTAVGPATGTLTFTDSAGDSPQTVSLSGTGSAPVTLSTSSLSFGTLTVGATSSTKSVTVTNRQNTSLSIGTITATAPFHVASTTCGTTLAGGASCSIGVTFTPTVSGTASGALTITDSAVNSPQTVSLAGSGR